MTLHTALLSVMLSMALPMTAGMAGPATPQPTGDAGAVVVMSAGTVTVSGAELLEVAREERVSGDLLRLARASTTEGLEQLSRQLLEQKLMARRAREAALDRTPGVARTLTRATERILADALLNRELAALDVSEPALRRYYDQHSDQFRSSPRRKARHVVVASRQEADAVAAEVQGGAKVADLALSRNIDTTRATSGDLGWVAPGVMVKPFDAALFAAVKGVPSAPVQTSFGWHVILVEDVDPGTLPPFELISEKVAAALKAATITRVKAAAFDGLTVNVDRKALGALVR